MAATITIAIITTTTITTTITAAATTIATIVIIIIIIIYLNPRMVLSIVSGRSLRYGYGDGVPSLGT